MAGIVIACERQLQVLFSFLRNMEDFVTWTDTSKIRKHVLEYNEEVSPCLHQPLPSREVVTTWDRNVTC